MNNIKLLAKNCLMIFETKAIYSLDSINEQTFFLKKIISNAIE